MGKFQVSPDELRQASNRIRAAQKHLGTHTVESTPEAGHAAVVSAANSFSAQWTSGTSHLVRDIEEIADRLDKTATIYESGDSAAKNSVERSESGTGAGH